MIASVLFLLLLHILDSFILIGWQFHGCCCRLSIVVVFDAISHSFFLFIINEFIYILKWIDHRLQQNGFAVVVVSFSSSLDRLLTVARIDHCDARAPISFFLSHLCALFVVWVFLWLSSHSLNFYHGITHLNAHNRILSSFHTNRLPIYTSYHSAPFLSISILHRHHPVRRSFKSIALLLLLIFFFQFVELNFNSYLKRDAGQNRLRCSFLPRSSLLAFVLSMVILSDAVHRDICCAKKEKMVLLKDSRKIGKQYISFVSPFSHLFLRCSEKKGERRQQ